MEAIYDIKHKSYVLQMWHLYLFYAFRDKNLYNKVYLVRSYNDWFKCDNFFLKLQTKY